MVESNQSNCDSDSIFEEYQLPSEIYYNIYLNSSAVHTLFKPVKKSSLNLFRNISYLTLPIKIALFDDKQVALLTFFKVAKVSQINLRNIVPIANVYRICLPSYTKT